MPEIFQKCPLCLTENTSLLCYGKHPERPYYKCQQCELIFVPNDWHLSAEEEKAIYDQHNNDPQDHGYREFLSKLARPVLARLGAGSVGLDFGCGPGPTLALIMQEAGYSCVNYDPIYQPDPSRLQRSYDFILSTEVFEHMSQPEEDISRLFEMINPGGLLGVMTKLIPKDKPFLEWHYIKDPTHISFYSDETLRYLADKHEAQLEILGPDVMIFKKP